MNETTHEIFGTIYKDVNDLSELNLPQNGEHKLRLGKRN
jgi:hypothetical protein